MIRESAICRVLIGILFAAFPAAGQTVAPPVELPGWTLAWHDEFEGTKIDEGKWEVLTRRDNYNNEKQYYLPEMASVADGMLRITAIEEAIAGKFYRSARLEGRYEQAYGRFEIRAKIPTTKGIWPAIWLLPGTVPWPSGGEIDIMEHKGSEPHIVSSAYHFAGEAGRHEYVAQRYRLIGDDNRAISWPDDFHSYAAEWNPDEIRFYVDGVEHYRITRAHVPVSSTPMHVVLNAAVGGNFDGDPDETTVFPQIFLVDYVRVYKKK